VRAVGPGQPVRRDAELGHEQSAQMTGRQTKPGRQAGLTGLV